MTRLPSLALFPLLALAACAAEVQRTRVTFTPAPEADRGVISIRAPGAVTPNTGYTRIIKSNSAWRYVGTIPAGRVFQPVGDVFTIVGANAHEAYLVVSDRRLVGFYLPGEGAFSPLSTPVPLVTE